MAEETKDPKVVTLEDQNKELQKENSELKKQIEQLTADKGKVQKDLDSSLKTVGELSEQLELRDKHAGGRPIVKIGKKSYRVIGKTFVTKKGRVSVEDLLKDEEELKRMVKIKSGSLVEVSGKGETN